jgi:hypothetical protein
MASQPGSGQQWRRPRINRDMNRKTTSRAVFLAAMIGTLAAQTKPTRTTESTKTTEPSRTSVLPTATEIFHLKTECMELGEKLEKNAENPGTVVSMHSRYDPKSNRCYVQLQTTFQTDKTKSLLQNGTVTTDTVQDVHTRQTLAMIIHRYADQPVFMGAIGDSGLNEEMYEAARKRIADLMRDPEDK